MVDPVDHGLPLRRQGGDDEAGGGAQVRRHDRGALERVDARDDGHIIVEADAGAKAGQLLHMHEAVLENGLANARFAPRPGHQRHELGLQIRGKAREGLGCGVHRRDAAPVAPHADTLAGGGDGGARPGHHVQRRLQKLGPRAFQQHIAPGHGHAHGVGAGLDAVGQHRVAGAAKARDAFDLDLRRPRALDLRAHLDEAVREIHHLGLARRILDERMPMGQRGRHEGRVGAAHGHLGKVDLAAPQPLGRAGDDITRLDLDLRPQPLQRHDQQIHRPRADGAAAGQGDLGLAHARQNGRDDPEARPHARDQLVGGGRVHDAPGVQMNRLASGGVIAGPLAVYAVIHALVAQNAQELRAIGQARHIVEGEGGVGEQRRDHERQGRVLGARNRDHAIQGLSADDPDPVHSSSLVLSVPVRGEADESGA